MNDEHNSSMCYLVWLLRLRQLMSAWCGSPRSATLNALGWVRREGCAQTAIVLQMKWKESSEASKLAEAEQDRTRVPKVTRASAMEL